MGKHTLEENDVLSSDREELYPFSAMLAVPFPTQTSKPS